MVMEIFEQDGVAALVEDGVVAEIRRGAGGEPETGEFYKARISYIDRGLDAAFVDIGAGKNAYLEFTDIVDVASAPAGSTSRIQGEEILVQVRRGPVGGKGARVTMRPSLAGALCVLLPGGWGAGISRKIDSPEERARLQRAAGAWLGVRRDGLEGFGVLVRTAAIGAEEEAIFSDLDMLLARWSAVREEAFHKGAPARLGPRLSPMESLLRDHPDAKAIPAPPGLLEAALRDAAARRVALPGGGAIAFDDAQALTAVDVDSASAAKARGFAETARRVNLEAAREITRQIRLRDLGGLIVVDFLDMRSPADRKAVEAVLREGLARDNAPVDFGGFTRLGLYEIARKRR